MSNREIQNGEKLTISGLSSAGELVGSWLVKRQRVCDAFFSENRATRGQTPSETSTTFSLHSPYFQPPPKLRPSVRAAQDLGLRAAQDAVRYAQEGRLAGAEEMAPSGSTQEAQFKPKKEADPLLVLSSWQFWAPGKVNRAPLQVAGSSSRPCRTTAASGVRHLTLVPPEVPREKKRTAPALEELTV